MTQQDMADVYEKALSRAVELLKRSQGAVAAAASVDRLMASKGYNYKPYGELTSEILEMDVLKYLEDLGE